MEELQPECIQRRSGIREYPGRVGHPSGPESPPVANMRSSSGLAGALTRSKAAETKAGEAETKRKKHSREEHRSELEPALLALANALTSEGLTVAAIADTANGE